MARPRDVFEELKLALERLAKELPQTTRRLEGFQRLQDWYTENVERIESEAARRGKQPSDFLIDMVDHALNTHLAVSDQQIRRDL
jgi:hypothetical protein